MLAKICPTCGVSEKEREFIKNVCVNCFQSNRVLYAFPKSLELLICPTCDRTFFNEWQELTEDDRAALLVNKGKFVYPLTKFTYTFTKSKESREYSLTLFFDAEGVEVTKFARITVRVHKNKKCKYCIMQSADYYEAIIQIRGERERVERAALKITKLLGPLQGKSEDLKEGIDIYSTSTAGANRALGHFSQPHTSSKKLWTIRNGRNIFKTTFCLRL